MEPSGVESIWGVIIGGIVVLLIAIYRGTEKDKEKEREKENERKRESRWLEEEREWEERKNSKKQAEYMKQAVIELYRDLAAFEVNNRLIDNITPLLESSFENGRYPSEQDWLINTFRAL